MARSSLPSARGARSLAALGLVAAGACGGAVPASSAPAPAEVTATYRVYVGAESADLLHRVRFGADGAVLERTTPVGEMAVETEGPHGFAVDPDGRFVYVTTGHGVPHGKLWKFDAGPDTLVGGPVALGYFPATLDLTPDGLYAFVSNFNLHGDMVPSTVSVIYTPDIIEVKRVETCIMPHGMRVTPDGSFAYSVCMMDDQLVELDTRTFEVSRRFGLATGAQGPVAARAAGTERAGGADRPHHRPQRHEPTCSPTWAEPSADGAFVYVACNGSDVIHELDREEWRVRRTFRTGRGPYNLEATPDGRLLVATLKAGAAVQFFDLGTGESVAVTPSSTTVTHGVVASPDSRYAFVSSEGVGAEPGRVDVFDLRTFERVAGVDVGQQAGGIAFWRMEGI